MSMQIVYLNTNEEIDKILLEVYLVIFHLYHT